MEIIQVFLIKTSFIKNVMFLLEYHSFLQLIFFLVVSSSLISNHISWIFFPEH